MAVLQLLPRERRLCGDLPRAQDGSFTAPRPLLPRGCEHRQVRGIVIPLQVCGPPRAALRVGPLARLFEPAASIFELSRTEALTTGKRADGSARHA